MISRAEAERLWSVMLAGNPLPEPRRPVFREPRRSVEPRHAILHLRPKGGTNHG